MVKMSKSDLPAENAVPTRRAVLCSEYSVDLPLTSSVDPLEIRDRLGLPSYVDMDYFPMQNAVVTIWAAINAPEMHKLYPNVFEKKYCDRQIPALMFGGCAVKIHCKDANSGGLLARNVKDTDFIVPKKEGWKFYGILQRMHKAFGTHYMTFVTSNDRRFTNCRYGERYRATTINGVTEDGTPTITVMDVLCDTFNFRHKLDIRDAFERYRENLYTIGLENLLLSKAQFIMDGTKEEAERLKEHGQEHRILAYPYYDKGGVIIGMEEKDVKDVCAIFLDHPVKVDARVGGVAGTAGVGGAVTAGAAEIDTEKLNKVLRKDENLALTVRLNLGNMVEHPDVLGRWLGRNEVSTVTDRIEALLKCLPKVDKKKNKPWWNTAVETPVIE
jgi:hypothetical protein